MARIRTIKPEFFTDSKLGQLSPIHRLLFTGLWTQADREGRLKDDPEHLKVVILPFDICEPDKLLADLNAASVIIRYHVKGTAYITIPHFLQHQRPNIREPASIIPSHNKHRPARAKHNPARAKPVPECSGREREGNGKGMEGNTTLVPSGTPLPLTVDELMEGWNTICAPEGLPKVTAILGKRLEKVRARMKEYPDPAWWDQMLNKIPHSPFLMGRKPRPGHENWKCTFDWVVDNSTNPLKIYEGNYDEQAYRPTSGR